MPWPPRKRPAISSDAQIVKIVSSVGTATMPVNTAWTNFKPAPTCGSANRWWKPIGIENTSSSRNAMRPILSL